MNEIKTETATTNFYTKREIDEIVAADKFVTGVLRSANSFDGSAPLWHGWALREAFYAGILYERSKQGANK